MVPGGSVEGAWVVVGRGVWVRAERGAYAAVAVEVREGVKVAWVGVGRGRGPVRAECWVEGVDFCFVSCFVNVGKCLLDPSGQVFYLT